MRPRRHELRLVDTVLRDADGYGATEYSSTMALADIFGDHKERICMRGYYGLMCQR